MGSSIRSQVTKHDSFYSQFYSCQEIHPLTNIKFDIKTANTVIDK